MKLAIFRFFVVFAVCALFFPIVAHSCTCEADAGTDVYGPIWENTTWTLENSPYCVTQNLIVLEGVTLTIEPGVVVKFWENTDEVLDEKFSIIVEGEIIAIGTKLQRILFTSSRLEPVAGDWNTIEFTETAQEAVFDEMGNYISGSILEYVTIEYGGNDENDGNDRNWAVHLEKSPFLNHVDIHDCDGGLYSGTMETNITNSTFTNNSVSASGKFASYGGAVYSKSSITITNSTFTNNSVSASGKLASYGGAVYSESSVTITNSDFTNNSSSASAFASSSGGAVYSESSVTIINSDFTNNSASVAYAAYSSGKFASSGGAVCSESSIIKDSTFTNNKSSSYYSSYGGAVCSESSIIEDSTFTNNSASSSFPFLYFSSYGGAVYSGSSVIKDSTFTNNSASAAPNFGYGGAIYSAIADISVTLFLENQGETIIHMAQGHISSCTVAHNLGYGINISSESSGLGITGSNILGNFPYDLYSETANDIDAIGNYWGTTDVKEIFLNIFDRFDDPKLGEVNFGRTDNSYLTDMAPNAPIIPTRTINMPWIPLLLLNN